MVEDIWYTLESNHERWYLMNTVMIKEVAYVECHQDERYCTRTIMSTCPTMWVDVSRSNIVVHRPITGHWCIKLTHARSPTNNENGNQGIECNLISVNRCVEVEHLEESIDQGILMYSQNYKWRENVPLMIVSLRHSNDSRILSQNKWSEVDGMESIGRRKLRHPPSTNMR